MIPITSEQTLTWTDPEDQTVFEFAYLTGERADRFMRLRGGGSLTPLRPYMAKATDAVKKRNAGRKWKKGEEAAAVVTEAQRLASAAGETDGEPPEGAMRELVDMVVVKWSGKDKAGKAFEYTFPEPDGAVSRFLALSDQAKLSQAIMERVGELARLDLEEVKN